MPGPAHGPPVSAATIDGTGIIDSTATIDGTGATVCAGVTVCAGATVCTGITGDDVGTAQPATRLPARDRRLSTMAAPSPPKYAGLIEAVAAFFIGTLLAGIGLQLGAAIGGYRQGSGLPMPLVVTVFELVGLWMGLIGGVLFYSRFWGSRDVRADVGLAFRWRFDLTVGVVVGVGTQLVLVPLLYLPFEQADPTLRHRLEGPAKADTSAVHGAWQIVVLALFLAVFAPIVEELFFRGLLLRSLTRWLGPAVGIAGSALAFGAAHGELLQLPALVVFGLILGVLAHRTGRLGPAMVAHAAFNAVTVLSLTLAR